jgi:hypothetical protein
MTTKTKTPAKTAKKKTSSSDLSAFIEMGTHELAKQTPAQRGIKVPAEPKEKGKPNKERFTINVPPDLIERARRTVVHTLGLTISSLVEEALTKELDLREKQNGGPFPSSSARPQTGRPVKLKA